MAVQLELREHKTIAELRFEQYHEAHPQIYAAFEQMALGQIALNRRHGSAKQIVEHLRMFTGIRAEGEQFKLDNSFTAYYSKKFIADHPDHASFFRTRRAGSY
jgi:hypothetical protein